MEDVRSNAERSNKERFNIIGGSCHKFHFCRGKHVFVAVAHVEDVRSNAERSNKERFKHVFVATKMKLVATPAKGRG